MKNVLDNNGDLETVKSKKNANFGFFDYAKNFTYNAAGAVTSMQLGNGRWESTTFNSRLQPTQIALGVTQNATGLLDLDYTYGTTNNNGNVLSQVITVPTVGSNPGFVATQTYSYDSLNRISQATETIPNQTGWNQSFSYDRYGNRNFVEAPTTTLLKQCSNNTEVCPADRPKVNPSIDLAKNQLIGYAFDNAGNTAADAENRTFIYDAENKQVQVNNTQGIVGQYFYDGDGRRVKKYVPATGEATIFVYDAAGKLVAEYSTIVANSTAAKVAYLTNDHLGSPRINTDENGATISRHDYHPFGEEIATSQRTAGLGYANDTIRKQFTGYERDNETGLDFAQARMYAKNLGRFNSPDPVGPDLNIPQTFNRFRYALNNPLRYNDKDGRYEEDVHRDLTRTLAYAAGFSMDDAITIANGNQGIDDNPGTSPMEVWRPVKGIRQREEWHFTTQERRDEIWDMFFVGNVATTFAEDVGLSEQTKGELRDATLKTLGGFFHTQQDSYSQASFSAYIGHLFSRHDPDKTYMNVGKADNMAYDTFTRLNDAARLMRGTSGAIPYSLIKDRITDFNRAKTKEDKDKILKSIEADIKAIREERERQKRLNEERRKSQSVAE